MRTRSHIVVAGMLLAAFGCADVGTGPDVPSSIDTPVLPYPAVVVGDTLRDENGTVAPIRAVVRNSSGEVLEEPGTRYLYVEFNRDSALLVDPTSGIVVAARQPSGEARLGARVGSSLQALRPILVTVRPDTLEAGAATSALTTVFPDTGRSQANRNTTGNVAVTLQNRQAATPTGVRGWIVHFELVYPNNPTNDTTAAAWLVNESGAASVVDTTSDAGTAERRVRVRAAQFPTSGTDTLVVRARATYRGQPVKGSDVELRIRVNRGQS